MKRILIPLLLFLPALLCAQQVSPPVPAPIACAGSPGSTHASLGQHCWTATQDYQCVGSVTTTHCAVSGDWLLVGPGSGGPPTGAAGGVLTGTYPNPGLGSLSQVVLAGSGSGTDNWSANSNASCIQSTNLTYTFGYCYFANGEIGLEDGSGNYGHLHLQTLQSETPNHGSGALAIPVCESSPVYRVGEIRTVTDPVTTTIGSVYVAGGTANSNFAVRCQNDEGTLQWVLIDGSGPGGIPTATVATLPASPSGNPTYLVTDGVSSGDCSVGGGSAPSICSWDGAEWISASWGNLLAPVVSESPVNSVGIDSAGNPMALGFSGACVSNTVCNVLLSQNPTVNTQSAGDNSTKAANTAFVTTAVAGNTLLDRTVGAVLTPSSLTGCIYVALAGTITAFHSNTVDGATNSTVLVKVETQPTRATFLSTGVSGASDISNGGEQLTSVLGKDDATLTSWSKTVAAGTTVCFVGSGFTLGTAVTAEINLTAN